MLFLCDVAFLFDGDEKRRKEKKGEQEKIGVEKPKNRKEKKNKTETGRRLLGGVRCKSVLAIGSFRELCLCFFLERW